MALPVSREGTANSESPLFGKSPRYNVGAEGNAAFGAIGLAVQVVMTGVFYTSELDLSKAAVTDQSSVYNYYVGVALMMFVGFGYLMTFLKAYGLGAVGFTMYITCFGVEYAILVESLMGKGELTIDFMSLLNGNFAVAAVLISFGGLIGKLSPIQILFLTIIELTCYTVNKVYFLQQYESTPYIQDCGGTIIIHVFGAYFGLMACSVLGPPQDDRLNTSSYTSDIFSLVGTVFLWLFWPSFVAGALPSGPGQTVALMNTVIALLASTVVTFAITPMMEKGKISTVPIQNATLAGGVSIGATANLVGPFGAIVIGGVAGIVSTVGFIKAPCFANVDTCGISNLHGMPGLLGGAISIAVPRFYEGTHIVPKQQAIGLLGTFGFACMSGAITGMFLRCVESPRAVPFSDETYWDCADNIDK